MIEIDQLIEEAQAALAEGDVVTADRLAQQIVSTHGDSGRALHLSGLVAAAQGRHRAAIELLQSAAASEPPDVRFLHDLAELFYRLDMFDAAEQVLIRAKTLAPMRADLPVKLGFVRLRLGRPLYALALLHRGLVHSKPDFDGLSELSAAILRAMPGDARALHGAGTLAARTGQAERAVDLLRQAANTAPMVVQYWEDLGQLHLRLNHLSAARDDFDRALALAPQRADLCVKQAMVLRRQEESGDAIVMLRHALALAPQSLEAKANLASLLASEATSEGALDESRQLFTEALALAPEDPNMRMNYGNLLYRLEGPVAAIECYKQATTMAPDNVDAWINFGRAQQDLGQFAEAEISFRTALQQKPNHAGAQRGLGHALLAQGRLVEGWDGYSYRFFVEAAEGRIKVRPFRQPWWRGGPLNGKRLIAWAEQGVGEELMFAGVLPELISEAAKIVIECDTRLVPLFMRSFPGANTVPRTTPPDNRATKPPIDFQCPLGNLAAQRRKSFNDFPDHTGYLAADPIAVADARSWLESRGPGLKVGIAWFSKNKNSGDQRSIPLRYWAPLLARPDVIAVDLQYGDTAVERLAVENELGWRVHRHPGIDQLADLDGFAALVSALDLVITISNTTAHMAGALGKACWVLLNDAPYWHWFPTRDDCPWYPTVRLFRQRRRGDWNEVLDRVGQVFEDWCIRHGGGS